jgi:hypothetical protein
MMSMYTQLLDAAFGQSGPVVVRPSKRSALDAVQRSRGERNEDAPSPADPGAVTVVLAREIAYDVALLELAEAWGIETDLNRFAQPLQERARLEQALRDRGIMLGETTRDTAAPPHRG